MTDVIHFFNPQPLYGVLQPADQADGGSPATECVVELRDVALQPAGRFAVTLVAAAAGEASVWVGMPDLREEDDGSLVLLLAGVGRVVFRAAERARVGDLFLRLANRPY